MICKNSTKRPSFQLIKHLQTSIYLIFSVKNKSLTFTTSVRSNMLCVGSFVIFGLVFRDVCTSSCHKSVRRPSWV